MIAHLETKAGLHAAAGAAQWSDQTDEFGVPTQAPEVGAQPFGFTGEQQDAESGLVYLRARMYDPATGRFLQRDPYAGLVGSPLSLHRYAYVQNNPINATDPSELAPYMCQRPPTNALEMLQFDDCLQQARERTRQRGEQAQSCPSARLLFGPLVPCARVGTHNANDGADRYESGGEIHEIIETPAGKVGILATILVEGAKIAIRNIAVYPLAAKKLEAGVTPFVAAIHSLVERTKAMGFETLVLESTRYSGANVDPSRIRL